MGASCVDAEYDDDILSLKGLFPLKSSNYASLPSIPGSLELKARVIAALSAGPLSRNTNRATAFSGAILELRNAGIGPGAHEHFVEGVQMIVALKNKEEWLMCLGRKNAAGRTSTTSS